MDASYTPGKRVYLPGSFAAPALRHREYCLGQDGAWWLRPPAGPCVRVQPHLVTVHDGGEVSIRKELWTGSWRGFLERGVWCGAVTEGPGA